MLGTPEFWVLIAFLLLLIGGGKWAFAHLTRVLDAHAQKVADQLEEAERLHKEALSLLQTYAQKHKDALKQSKDIIALADKESEEFRESRTQELDHVLAQKEKSLLARLAHEREEILENVRKEMSKEAVGIVKRFLAHKEKESKALTEKAVKEISDLNV